MNSLEKEIETIFLDEEEKVLNKLKSTYAKSLNDVKAYAKKLQDDLNKLLDQVDEDDENAKSLIRSKVYQIEYQKQLAKQIEGYMNVITDKNIKTISDYLNVMYNEGFLTQNYALNKQGVGVIMPINQKLLIKAITYNTDNIPLSKRLYSNVEKAKKDIIAEISRGLSIGASTADMARNLENTMGVSFRKAYQIAQNEGARVREESIIDSLYEAKRKGADIVKRWSATLDGKTRPVHRELEGKWVELEDDFEYSGGKVFAPKQFGIPSEDINCRCTLIGVPRWELEDTYVKRDNESKELVKVSSYQDWKENYLTSIRKTVNNVRGMTERNMAMGLRSDPYIILDDLQIQSIKQDAISIGVPIDVLRFNIGKQTGFVDSKLYIVVRGDILPDINSKIVRDRMSQRAVLAHEYYGHYLHYPSNFDIGDWRDEFQASYFASINAPNLTDEERRDLMIDAFDRAREANIPVKLNKEAWRIIYGYEKD